jgi:hypothetical protein
MRGELLRVQRRGRRRLESTAARDLRRGYAPGIVRKGNYLRRISPGATLALGVAVLVGAACSSNAGRQASPGTSAAATPTPAGPLVIVPDLNANNCGLDFSSSASVEITVVRRQTLFGALPDGSNMHCIVGLLQSDPGHWSDDGRTLLESTNQVLTASSNNGFFQSDDIAVALARPLPDAAYVTSNFFDFGRQDSPFNSPRKTLANLKDGTPVVNPSGDTVAIVGGQQAGQYGIWIVPTKGGPVRLASSFATTRIASGQTSYASASNGAFIDDTNLAYVIGPPGSVVGPFHPAILNISTGRVVDLGQAAPAAETGQDLRLDVLPGATPKLALAIGDCTSQSSTYVYNGATAGEAPHKVDIPGGYDFVDPQGWLPDGRLLVLARRADCKAPGDLFLWSSDQHSVLYTEGVTGAAVRPGSSPSVG